MHSKVCRTLFTQSKGIQHCRKHESEHHTNKNNNANYNYLRPTCHSYTSGEPVKKCLHSELSMWTECQNERLKCYQYCIHYHTSQQQCHDRSLTTNTCDSIHQQNSEHCAHKSQNRRQRKERTKDDIKRQHKRYSCPQRRARRGTDEIRIGQGVA